MAFPEIQNLNRYNLFKLSVLFIVLLNEGYRFSSIFLGITTQSTVVTQFSCPEQIPFTLQYDNVNQDLIHAAKSYTACGSVDFSAYSLVSNAGKKCDFNDTMLDHMDHCLRKWSPQKKPLALSIAEHFRDILADKDNPITKMIATRDKEFSIPVATTHLMMADSQTAFYQEIMPSNAIILIEIAEKKARGNAMMMKHLLRLTDNHKIIKRSNLQKEMEYLARNDKTITVRDILCDLIIYRNSKWFYLKAPTDRHDKTAIQQYLKKRFNGVGIYNVLANVNVQIIEAIRCNAKLTDEIFQSMQSNRKLVFVDTSNLRSVEISIFDRRPRKDEYVRSKIITVSLRNVFDPRNLFVTSPVTVTTTEWTTSLLESLSTNIRNFIVDNLLPSDTRRKLIGRRNIQARHVEL